jgi:DNA-binding transcriptional ArsR family regulator
MRALDAALKRRIKTFGSLRGLAKAGLLTTHREGYYVIYSLNPEKLATLSDALGQFLESP